MAEFDPIAGTPDRAEAAELDVLTERGAVFTVPKRSVLKRFSKKKQRSFLLQQPYLGTLDLLSREFIQMNFSEQQVAANPLGESKRLLAHNTVRCARVVALSVLNSRWKIRWLSGLYTRYFLWHLTPQTLSQLVFLIHSMSGLADFTNSIRYLSVVPRTTDPTLVEEKTSQDPPQPSDMEELPD